MTISHVGSDTRRPLTTAGTSVNTLFLDRWSPRAFEKGGVSLEQLRTLFEAARWAPSCFNDQPWEFKVAHTDDALVRFRPILVDANRAWTDQVPVLAVLFARLHFTQNQKPNAWAQFDCGSAWTSIALHAQQMGLAAHAMAGFHEEVAYKVCGVSPETHKALCVIAIGQPAHRQALSPEALEREKPNARKPLSDVVQFS